MLSIETVYLVLRQLRQSMSSVLGYAPLLISNNPQSSEHTFLGDCQWLMLTELATINKYSLKFQVVC